MGSKGAGLGGVWGWVWARGNLRFVDSMLRYVDSWGWLGWEHAARRGVVWVAGFGAGRGVYDSCTAQRWGLRAHRPFDATALFALPTLGLRSDPLSL